MESRIYNFICRHKANKVLIAVWEHEAFNSQPALVSQAGPRELLQLQSVNSSSSGQYTCKIWNNRGRKILRKV